MPTVTKTLWAKVLRMKRRGNDGKLYPPHPSDVEKAKLLEAEIANGS